MTNDRGQDWRWGQRSNVSGSAAKTTLPVIKCLVRNHGLSAALKGRDETVQGDALGGGRERSQPCKGETLVVIARSLALSGLAMLFLSTQGVALGCLIPPLQGGRGRMVSHQKFDLYTDASSFVIFEASAQSQRRTPCWHRPGMSTITVPLPDEDLANCASICGSRCNPRCRLPAGQSPGKRLAGQGIRWKTFLPRALLDWVSRASDCRAGTPPAAGTRYHAAGGAPALQSDG